MLDGPFIGQRVGIGTSAAGGAIATVTVVVEKELCVTHTPVAPGLESLGAAAATNRMEALPDVAVFWMACAVVPLGVSFAADVRSQTPTSS
jgi:hypothetical protein